MRLKEFLLGEQFDAKAFADWKQAMKAKGAVEFESVELDNVLAKDKAGRYLGAFDKQRNVAEAAKPGDEDYDGDPANVDTFWVAGWNEEEDKSWVGKVSKTDGKWVESTTSGAAPDNWGGKRYMSYLTPSDVMGWLSKDYNEVDGPFFDEDEAIEHAEHRYGPLSEAWVDSGAKDANGKWADYRDGKIGVEAMATWLYGSRVHKKTRADKLKSAYGAIAQQENTSKLINNAKGDALRAALKKKYGSED